jgi:alpha-2-macroglobulin
MSLLLRWSSMGLGLVACAALLAGGITSEVQVGSYSGRLIMAETGKPLPNALVTLDPQVKDPDGQFRTRFAETDDQGGFRIPNLLAGAYMVSTSTKAHELKSTIVTIGAGKPTTAELQAKPIPPYLNLNASQHVWTPSEKPRFEINGFFDAGNVQFETYKLDTEKVLAEGSLYNALAPLARRGTNKMKDPATMGTRVRTWKNELKNRDAEGVFVETINLEPLDEGIYWMTAEGGKMEQGTWFMVSKIALVTKNDGKSGVGFVTDLQTGEPQPGVTVGFNVGGTFTEVGKTNQEGTVRFTMPPAGDRPVLMAVQNQSRAFVDLYRGSQTRANTRVATYTDRPIYRPGDEVSFKGIVRTIKDTQMVPPAVGKVRVELRDTDDEPVSAQQLDLNAMGSFNGKVRLNKEVPSGYYTLVTQIGEDEYRAGFSVASYRKPTYKINMTALTKPVILGDKARVKLRAEYYFGGPVPGAKVEAFVYRNPSWSDELDPGYEEVGGETVAEVKATTDNNGEAILEFPTRIAGDAGFDTDFDFNVQASVADPAGKFFDGQTSFRVTRGEFQLNVDSNQYFVREGQSLTATLKAADYEGKPIAGSSVEVRFGEYRWDRKAYTMVEPQTQTVTLDSQGNASVTVSAKRAGYFRMEASVKDARGNVILASRSFWIDGVVNSAEGEPWPSLEVTLDKEKYKVGESARLLIKTDKPGGSALVTVEARDLMSTRVVPLSGRATTLDIPVEDSFTPNVRVGVTYVREKRFLENTADLQTELGWRKLQIKVEPTTPEARPGQPTSFKVTTLNEQGSPVPAEVSLGVVDASIYDLAQDNFDLATELYPNRYSSVETGFSFPEVYLDGGDKAPASIEVRRRFEDTALWAPAVMTDVNGSATIPLTLPDNLTTWRATARGVTSRTEVGQSTSEMRASKPLMVRLETPEFLTAGDQQTIKAVISNRLGKDQPIKLQLESSGLEVVGDVNRTVTVANDGTESAEFTVKVTQPGNVKLTAKVWADGTTETDGVERALTVKPYGRDYIDQSAGDVTGTGQFKVTLREGADPNTGRLKLTLAPNLATALVGPLEGLIGFPYGCVEQTMSRFMPTLVVANAMKTAKLPAPAAAAQIPEMVETGLTRLYSMQSETGGWGWFENDESDPFLTAYVLDGMARAKQAGYKINAGRMDRALDWSATYLKTGKKREWESPSVDISNRAYLVYAMAAHGRPEAREFLAKMNTSTPSALAYAILARKALGADFKPQVDRLAGLATKGSGIASWPEEYWGVETSARVLAALVAADSAHPLVKPTIRYLLLKKRGEGWWSTRDTSFAVQALAGYLAKFPEAAPKGEMVLRLNGSEVWRGAATDPSGLPRNTVEIPLSRLAKGENALELAQTGGGTIFYTTDLRQVVTSEEIPEVVLDSGLKITRSYHVMRADRFEDGSTRLLPTKDAVSRTKAGDLIQVQIKITSDREREFVLIEDPIPASARVTERSDLAPGESWSWWWSKTDVRDDRVAFFARVVPKGESQITYVMRAEMVGTSRVLPTVAYTMYDPMNRASTAGGSFEVTGP